ncbi:MAG: hypothetical protein AAGF11_05115 [Myxococcota bacterium]
MPPSREIAAAFAERSGHDRVFLDTHPLRARNDRRTTVECGALVGLDDLGQVDPDAQSGMRLDRQSTVGRPHERAWRSFLAGFSRRCPGMPYMLDDAQR